MPLLCLSIFSIDIIGEYDIWSPLNIKKIQIIKSLFSKAEVNSTNKMWRMNLTIWQHIIFPCPCYIRTGISRCWTFNFRWSSFLHLQMTPWTYMVNSGRHCNEEIEKIKVSRLLNIEEFISVEIQDKNTHLKKNISVYGFYCFSLHLTAGNKFS